MGVAANILARFKAKQQGELPHGVHGLGPHCFPCRDRRGHKENCRGCGPYCPLDPYVAKSGQTLLDSDYYVCAKHYREQWRARYHDQRCPV